MMNRNTLLIALSLIGCDTSGDLPAYYQGGPAPTPSAISQHSESGNIGGDIVRIVGENFGGNSDGVTVVFGSQNADVISVGNDEVVVRVPQGPIQGGTVPVVVATTHGQGAVPGGYRYDLGENLEDQAGYIVVSNQWESCLGGVGRGFANVGCDQIAYTGFTGIEGRAAFLDVKYPNVHSMYVGWSGGSDLSFGEWKVQIPAQMPNTLDIENSYEELKSDEVSGFRLINTAWDDEDVFEDPQWCADLTHMESYRYSGALSGEQYRAPFVVSAGGSSPVSDTLGTSLLESSPSSTGTCLEADGRRVYDRRQMNFCDTHEYDNPEPRDFRSSWPVGQSFFVGIGEEEESPVLDATAPAEIVVDVPGLGMNQTLLLPPALSVTATSGFDDASGIGDFSLWGLMGLSTCEDSNGNGEFDLGDAAMSFEWAPFTEELSNGEGVKASRSYVRFTINVMDLGWFGAIGSSIRASIAVEDEHNFDPETGLSSIEIPASIMYQFPSVDSDIGGETNLGMTRTLKWSDPTENKYGYMIITVDRVTEYTLEADDLDGDVVFAYATGDFGFMSWDNPLLDPRSCNDCTDNDMDGWVDADDPDCRAGDDETNASFGATTCNDGLDNDGDGLVDAEDTDCDDGHDSESPECGDEIDNDLDGWIDEEDPDCTEGRGLFEDGSGAGTYTCNNGIDDDADGWVDSEDPACEEATSPENDGVATGDDAPQCNDGIDNDGNGDADHEDMTCANFGATYDLEARPVSGDCADSVDNDEDGYTDGKDPDCELRPYQFENKPFFGPGPETESDEEGVVEDEDYPKGIDQCYDGIDNDGDGGIDAEDPGCIGEDGIPNGFINDESRALFVPEDTPDDSEDTGGLPDDTGSSGLDSGSAPD